ncbi:MAG: hypothetical protein ACFE8E_02910 [Candidatus Hodarchaeota archaeon]
MPGIYDFERYIMWKWWRNQIKEQMIKNKHAKRRRYKSKKKRERL